VIQQGRLAEQNSSLEKDELMKMVRFGADEILNGKGGLYTDEDIDALIAKGEERTEAMQAKLQTDAQHSLANFSLLADDGTGRDTFSFDGKNYRDSEKAAGNFINLPQRQRKRTYDISAIEQGASSIKAHAAETAAKKKRKGPALHDFQLFDLDRHNSLLEKERALVTEKEQQMRRIKDLQTRAMTAPAMGSGVATGHSREELQKLAADKMLALDSIKLSDEEEREKKKILAEGFVDWSRKDYRTFCMALERHGRYDFDAIFRDVESDTGKGRAEIQRYFVAFFTHYTRIQEWPRILERIERGEKKILRLRQIRDAIQEKVERHLQEVFGDFYSERGMEKPLPPVSELINHSWSRMKINYGSAARRGYQEAEDAFLICMMYRHGYGAAERIRMEIRRAWQFRFNWYFKSRSSQDIQKRCDMLIRMIERENAETQEKENKTIDSTDAPIPNQTEA
jgi:SWI/SNF-related matrix-associated actin-dependent regulator of chromatin subfamily A member 5